MLARLAESVTQVLHINDYEETSNDLQRRVTYFELIRGSRRRETLSKRAAPWAALSVNVFIVLKLYCIEPFAHIARIVGIQ
jgi:hypothetical protein